MPYYGFGYGFGIDPAYLLLVVVSLVLGMATQGYINSTYRTWSKVKGDGASGADVARRMLDANGCGRVGIKSTAGHLTDHYDPKNMVLRLSDSTANSTSVAALGVAAHEAGHVLQHRDGYAPLMLRTAAVPVVNIGSNLSWPLFLVGLIFSWEPLLYAGIALFALAVLFALITLPVEFNASRRAIQSLSGTGLLDSEELRGARKVLTAAALTYVAALLVSLAQLLRYLLAFGGRRRN